MSRRHDTSTRILDVAERYVMQRGYHAFSYQHIAEELGVKAPAVHYHFRTKPQLVLAVLERYGARFEKWASLQEGKPAEEQLDAYIALNRSFVEANRICALGMMAADYNAVPTEVQDRTEHIQAQLFDWFASLLARGRAGEVFSYRGTPEDKATEVVCALLGAQQLGRVRGLEAFERAVAQIRLSVVGSVPYSSAKSSVTPSTVRE